MPGLVDTNLTGAKLSEANVSVNMMFKTALSREVPLWYKDVTTEVTSGGAANKYPFMGVMSPVREWLGDRIYDMIARHVFQVVNKTFEKSVEVPVDDIEDDQIGSYDQLVSQVGYQCLQWPQDQVLAALQAGGSSLCFDGQYFFDTDHPTDPGVAGSSTYANLFTSTALSSTNFSAVLAAMQLIAGRDGRPLGFEAGTGLLLVVPPQLREVANQIVGAPFLASGATNVNAGMAKVLVIPQLGIGGGANATTWFLMQSGGSVKPFLFQLRQSPTIIAKAAPSDTNVVEKNVARWLAKMRGRAAYSLPWLAAKATA